MSDYKKQQKKSTKISEPKDALGCGSHRRVTTVMGPDRCLLKDLLLSSAKHKQSVHK